MSVDVFKIYTDRLVYFPGTKVVGQVKLIVARGDLKVRKMTLKVLGQSQVQWKSKSINKEENKIATQRSTIINHTMDLVTSTDSVNISPGEYTYPFEFGLPKDVISSKSVVISEKEKGHVNYTITADIDIPWGADKTTSETFFVTEYLDLNNKIYQTEVEKFGTKKRGILCCKSGPLNVTVSLNKAGFVPGEKINACIQIDNECGKDVGVIAKLVQKIQLPAASATKETPLLTEVIKQKIRNDESETVHCLLQVPPCPVSSISSVDPLDVTYEVKVMTNPSGISFALETKIPITIGSIPGKNSLPTFYRLNKPNSDVELPPDQISDLNDIIKTGLDKNGVTTILY